MSIVDVSLAGFGFFVDQDGQVKKKPQVSPHHYHLVEIKFMGELLVKITNNNYSVLRLKGCDIIIGLSGEEILS